MIRTLMSARLGFTAVLFAACATPRAQPADASAMTVADTTPVVVLARGACHGTCPIYSVEITARGTVRFAGTRFVRHVGIDSGSVATDKVVALQSSFTARKFGEVPTAIEYGTPACGASYVADLPTNELTFRSAGGTHRVRWDEGCRTHPPMLDTLARMVDSVSGTARWTIISRR